MFIVLIYGILSAAQQPYPPNIHIKLNLLRAPVPAPDAPALAANDEDTLDVLENDRIIKTI